MKFGVLAGLRVSEIFGLRRGRIAGDSASIVERVSQGDVDTPKTEKSKRVVALSSGLQEDLKAWLAASPNTGPDGWLFPSESLRTPVDADNVMDRYIRRRLKTVGLGWVDYRVLRRTHSTLMNQLKVDPVLVADQQGHGVDFNLNLYRQASLPDRLKAVEVLESAFVN